MFDLRFLSGFLAIPWFNAACSSSPDLVGEFDDHAQFRPFRFLDAALDIVLLLECAALGGDEAEHDDLVALGQEAQRLEAAGALGIVFEKITVVVDLAQQRLRHRLVALPPRRARHAHTMKTTPPPPPHPPAPPPPPPRTNRRSQSGGAWPLLS